MYFWNKSPAGAVLLYSSATLFCHHVIVFPYLLVGRIF